MLFFIKIILTIYFVQFFLSTTFYDFKIAFGKQE